MQKTSWFVATLLLVCLGLTSANGANQLIVDPVELLQQTNPGSSARGIVFVENFSPGASIGSIRYSHLPTFRSDGSIAPSDYWNWKVCTTWTDSSCPVKDGYVLEGKVILGSCLSGSELGCIDTFKAFNSFGAGINLKLVGKSFPNAIDIPEDSILGLPRSSSPPLYSDSEGNLYIVRASLLINITGTSKPVYKLDVDINPVYASPDKLLEAPKVIRNVEPRTGLGVVNVIPSPSQCISTDVGICYKAMVPKSDFKYLVSVRVPRSVSGWLRGRVSEPNFDVQLINDKSQLISVSAKSVRIPIAGGWANYSDLPSGFIEKIWPSGGYDSNPNSSYFLVANSSQGDRGMFEYTSWAPYLKEKALTTATNWSFGTNISGNDQMCLQNPGEISGFVASNASVYSTRPPEWDASTSTLIYRVAAPHFDENGNVNTGNYTLAMPLKSIQCLYGQNNLPPSATVSLVYENDVVNVATVTLKSDSGWINFSANGFHYSEPTIKVKFGEVGATPITTPLPSPNESTSVKLAPSTTATLAPQPGKSAAPTVALKTQWCAKGYAKKKVTAANPVCPKGYKKIANPTIR